MKYVVAVFFVAILTAGCATFNVSTYYPEGKYPPTDPGSVQLYRNDPPRQFEVIGEAHLAQGFMLKSDEKKLKEQAASIGGDAVVWRVKKEYEDTTITPAKTTLVLSQSSTESDNTESKKKVSTIESSPMQIQQSYNESIEAKIIKFVR